MSLTGRGNGFGASLDQVVDGRQVVRGKIPNHIYVMLKQPQIHARGIVVIQLAQGTVLQ